MWIIGILSETAGISDPSQVQEQALADWIVKEFVKSSAGKGVAIEEFLLQPDHPDFLHFSQQLQPKGLDYMQRLKHDRAKEKKWIKLHTGL